MSRCWINFCSGEIVTSKYAYNGHENSQMEHQISEN